MIKSKDLEEKVIGLLKNTPDNQKEIARKVRLDNARISKIQNKAIKEGKLEEKYKRLAGGVIKYQKDRALDFIRWTGYNYNEIAGMVEVGYSVIKRIKYEAIKQGFFNENYKRYATKVQDNQRNDIIKLLKGADSLNAIGKKVNLSPGTIRYIQDEAIKNGILDEKYRRGISQYQKDEVIRLLKNTKYNSMEIKNKTGISGITIRKIQNTAINEGILDEKYRRLAQGVIQYQQDEVIKLLKDSEESLERIGKEVGLTGTTVGRIQDKAIEDRILDEKYKRLKGCGSLKYHKDLAIKFLEETDYNLLEISKKAGLSAPAVGDIQSTAINEGMLDEKYRRLAHGVIKYQKDEVIKLLKETNYSLSKLSRRIELSYYIIKEIQNKAIKEGMLDKKYKRTNKSLEQQLIAYGGK